MLCPGAPPQRQCRGEVCKGKREALAAHPDKAALEEVQRTAVLEHGKPPPTPAEQLALLRAEQGTKRPGVGQ